MYNQFDQYRRCETFKSDNKDVIIQTKNGFRMYKTKTKNSNFLEGKEYYKCSQFNSKDQYIMILSPKENLFDNIGIQCQSIDIKAIKRIKMLKSPQLAEVFDFGYTKDKSYIVTENIDFLLMEYVFQKDKTYNTQQVIELFKNLILQIGGCLACLEGKLIVLQKLEIVNIGVKIDSQRDSNRTIFKIFDFSHARCLDQQSNSETLKTEFSLHAKLLGKILMDLYQILDFDKNDENIQQLTDLIEKIQQNQIQGIQQIFEHPLMNMVYQTLILLVEVDNFEKQITQSYNQGISDMVLQSFV